MSLEMAHKVILPPKKNYIPQFLKQRDINSYCILTPSVGDILHYEGYCSILWTASPAATGFVLTDSYGTLGSAAAITGTGVRLSYYQKTKYVCLQSTTVYVPSSKLGHSHPPSRQRVCPTAPPPGTKGGGGECGRGVGGVPIPTMGEKA
jgi:hypothetical protein